MNIREWLFRGFDDGCSNHHCVIKGENSGMCTNASCQCVVNLSRSKLSILQSRIDAIADFDSGIKRKPV